MVKAPVDPMLARVSSEWLAWTPRIGALCTTSTSHPPSKKLKDAFTEELRHRPWYAGSVSDDDIREASTWLFAKSAGLSHWFGHALAAANVRIDPVGVRPRVEAGCFEAWSGVLDYFDEDVLAAFAIGQCYGGAVTTYADWATLLRGGDSDIDTLLRRGVADMHVHLGGARQPPGLWRRLLSDETRLEDLPRYRPARVADPNAAALRAERNLILAALGRDQDIEPPRQTLLQHALECSPRPMAPQSQTRTAYQEFVEHREEERWLLAHGWAAARAACDDPSRDLFRVVKALDLYAWGRSRINAGARQPVVSGMHGLADFSQNWFRAVPQRRLTRLARKKSPRLALDEHAEALGAISESSALQRLELRISPLRSPIQYRRFFALWSELERRLGFHAGAGRPDIRFAVHFQRRDDEDPRRLITVVDRQSAALQTLRLEFPEEARRISRIDLAGEERKGAGRWFYPFMRLLRGDGVAPRDEVLSPAWSRLARDKRATPAAGADRLGASCHAGEDFPDLLYGLYEVGGAVKGLKLRAGDSLGHALVLAWEPQGWERRSKGFSWIKAGQCFDSRVWFLGRLARLHEKHAIGEALRSMADQVAADAVALYGDEGLRSQPWIDWAAREHVSNKAPWEADDAYPWLSLLARRDIEDEQVRARRAEGSPAKKSVRPDLLALVQTSLRDEIADRGIVIELNPSSNQRTSGAKASGYSPLVSMLRLAEGLSLSLSTDDPGVFGTCIENEYALAAELLAYEEMPRVDLLRRLDDIRKNSLESIAWPSARPRATARPRRAGAH